MAKTKAPSGLGIARSAMRFTLTWKIADDNYNDGQQLQWRTNLDKSGKWTSITIGTTTVSRTITLTAADYYPATSKMLQTVTFRVRGKRAKKDSTSFDWSSWSEKSFTVNVPNVPSLTATLNSELSNVTTFTWNTSVSDTDSRHFTHVEWQTRLTPGCKETDGSKISWTSTKTGWATGTGPRNSSITRTEDTATIAGKSYTRWVRVRARGARGASAWRYAKHVYATPNKAVIDSVSSSVANGVTTCMVKWTVGSNAAYPIDKTILQYAICVPATGQACPADAGWEEANVSRDTGGQDAAKFTIPDAVGTDECLFVRVVTQHDDNYAYSAAKLVRRGSLAAPENISVETNEATFRATITADNTSDVPDAKLAVIYRPSSNSEDDVVVGIMNVGESSVTVQCPNWSTEGGAAYVAFGVYAFQGTVKAIARADNVTAYAVTANMKSGTVWRGGSVPVAPENVAADISGDETGEVIVTWDWTWEKANAAEISWSANPNAWESTDQPQTYTVNNLHAAKWRVSGLTVGMTWYFRVRLLRISGDNTNYGPYSEAAAVDMTSAPATPVLMLSSAVITAGESVTASWVYSTTDGTAQAYAEICEAEVEGDSVTYGEVIAHATTEQHVVISSDEWSVGMTYYLCVRVTSASGHVSDRWSDPIPVTVADPIRCTIEQISLVPVTMTDDVDESRTVQSLTVMPLTVTVTGAGEGGTTTISIERAEEYHMIRPDGSSSDGYEGETVALLAQNGEGQMIVSTDDLIGRLDDGAAYRLVAVTEDGLGQSASAEIEFEVHWTHQAEIPDAVVEEEDGIIKIRPIAPAGAAAEDVCDIYRLTADLPELIVENGSFGTTYVDPYPAIGREYGHRIVHRTVNGDYITEDNHPAWIDITGEKTDEEYSIIIDFAGSQLVLPYDITLSSRWDKDFKLTNYLGGAQQGDWNPAVTRTSTYTVSLIADEDAEMISGMRELAAYSGICHIRTPEGSSYAANIEVTENKVFSEWDTVNYTLAVTKIDPEELDGIPYSEWIVEE